MKRTREKKADEMKHNMNYDITLQRYDGLQVDLAKLDFGLFVMVFQTQVTH